MCQSSYSHTQLVIDTNIWVSALINSEGPPRDVIDRVLSGACNMHLTVPIVFEYEKEIRRYRPLMNLSKKEATRVIDLICDVGHQHNPTVNFQQRIFAWDQDDAHVLQAVVSTPATALITKNVVDFAGPSGFTGAPSWNICVLTAREYLSY